jgi:hypothetical protein
LYYWDPDTYNQETATKDHNKTKEGFKTKVVGLCKKKKNSKHPTKAKGGGGKRGAGGRATRMIEYRKK